MNSLEITYYVDFNAKTLRPFIQEKDNNKNDWSIIQHLKAAIDNADGVDKEKKLMFLSTIYYIDLFKKGYPYEEIDHLLREEFFRQYDAPRSQNAFNCESGLDYIVMEREAAKDAFERYLEDKNCYGLSEFVEGDDICGMLSDISSYGLKRRLKKEESQC